MGSPSYRDSTVGRAFISRVSDGDDPENTADRDISQPTKKAVTKHSSVTQHRSFIEHCVIP
jgi:hypothetical protein